MLLKVLAQFSIFGIVAAIGPCSIGAPGLEGIPAALLAIPGMPTIPGMPLLDKSLKCTEKGYFELVQCKADYCVCVDPSTGAEATATKTTSNKIRPQCGRCHFQLSRYYRESKNFIFRPICDAKTGNYQPQQCRDEKHCFCVNYLTGVRQNKKEVPTNEILHCEGGQVDFSIDDSHIIKSEKGEGGKGDEELIPIGSPVCKKPRDAGHRCHGRAGGPIAAKNLKWYFDTETFECLAFSYNGCGGNGNHFDSPADCWDKCKLVDLAGCAGMRLPATDKQGHTIICAGAGYPSPTAACPSGYRCTMLAHMGVCCHSATQDLYEANYRPTCPNGRQALQMQTRGVPMTLIGKKCADNFCPTGTKCVEKEVYAHCC
ncbi:hypothetical protein niasHS_009331 [Heterodera schachtii]|uniref:BPTI/Kunitz inhibitor domain-containing protein n=1 Tax=Heterodera schachtii TaxID=97005 RepID=A0ABD2JBS7_HETSC